MTNQSENVLLIGRLSGYKMVWVEGQGFHSVEGNFDTKVIGGKEYQRIDF
jgi:hypothetical protein